MDINDTILAEKAVEHSREVVKHSDHSPARSSVKNLKAVVATKCSTKSIPTFGGNNKFVGKTQNKSQTSLMKSEYRKESSEKQLNKKTVLPITTKSRNTTIPTGNSKIPGFKRSPGNSLNTKTETPQKPCDSKKQTTKSVGQKLATDKKKLQPKLDILTASNSKSSITQSETSQYNAMASSISKASFVTSSTKKIYKSQSARSSSVCAKSLTTKRSSSNISNRSISCNSRKFPTETNLRKMLSTSGDHNKNNEVNEISEKRQDLRLSLNGPEKSSLESFDVIKNEIKLYVHQWFSSVKEELKDSNESEVLGDQKVQEKLEHLQILKSHDILSLIDDLCAKSFENSDMQISKLKKELEESNKNSKKEETKYNELLKLQEEQHYKKEREIQQNAEADMEKKNEEIKELQKKSKSLDKELSNLKSTLQNIKKEKDNLKAEKDQLQDDLVNSRESIMATNKKLQQIEQHWSQEKKEVKQKIELIKKLEIELEDKKKLEIQNKEMLAKIQELESKIKMKSLNPCTEHVKQISELTNKVEYLESTQKEITQENLKLKQEAQDLKEVLNKLKEAENKIKELEKLAEDKEKFKEIPTNCCKEQQLEIAKLRQSDNEKRREIEKLKIELSKTQFNICQLEQQIQRDQQLLEVRSELIKSLQANEKTHRIHMEELFAQVSEKNTTINELNSELQNKSEEFRNIFNNLSAKQVENSNQEHIIKLLEESNERSQLLRVKQEEKIGRMEDELAHLKQTIAIYQGNILTGNHGKHLLLAPVLPPSNVDYNENFYYYVNQRKRKRQVDINVKKYEA